MASERKGFMDKQYKQISICIAGTILEWYDFALFACFTPIIAQLFFPTQTRLNSMMLTFAIFATGFIARPLGAIVFGHVGDKIGRKSTLYITIILMAIATTGIGLVPNHLPYSYLPALILAALRLLQGFAASGEYAGTITFLAELAKPSKRNFIASLGIFSAVLGAVAAALVSSATAIFLTHEQILAWGWRIPFLMGMPLGIIGLLFRYKLHETRLFEKQKQIQQLAKIPAKEVIKEHWPALLRLCSFYMLASVGFYINVVYINSYLASINKYTAQQTLYSALLCNVIYALFILLSAYLADKWGRKMLMLLSALGFILGSYGLFIWIVYGQAAYAVMAQAIIALLTGIFAGPLAAVSAESFPTKLRYTGVGLALNLPNAIFGGITPLVAGFLIKVTDNDLAPGFYLIAAALAAFLGSLSLSDKKEECSLE